MAFGFPAYAIDNKKLNVDSQILKIFVCDVLAELCWSYEVIDSNTIIGRISSSLSSWGEKITISLTEDGEIEVKSKCAMPLQCIDYGKNKRNINLFFAQLTRVIWSSFSLNANKNQAMFDESGTTPFERVLLQGKNK